MKTHCAFAACVAATTIACGGGEAPSVAVSDPWTGDWQLEYELDLSALDWGWPEVEPLRHPFRDLWPRELEFFRTWLEPWLEDQVLSEPLQIFLDVLGNPPMRLVRGTGQATVSAGWIDFEPRTLQALSSCGPMALDDSAVEGPFVSDGDAATFAWTWTWSLDRVRASYLDGVARCSGADGLKDLLDTAFPCAEIPEELSDPFLGPAVKALCEVAKSQVDARLQTPGLGEVRWDWFFEVGDEAAGFDGVRTLRVTDAVGEVAFGTWRIEPSTP